MFKFPSRQEGAATSLCPQRPDSRPLRGAASQAARGGAHEVGVWQGRSGAGGGALGPHGRPLPGSLVSREAEAARPHQPCPWPAPRPGGPLQRGLLSSSLAEACSRRQQRCPAWGARCGGPASLLVVIGGVREGELEAVGLSQQQADVLVTPVGGGQVLKEEQQLLWGQTAVRGGGERGGGKGPRGRPAGRGRRSQGGDQQGGGRGPTE